MDEILKEDNGAQFYRADLHIHSYGPNGSYDVTDSAMTPGGIVDAAAQNGIALIAITDHNDIGNVATAVNYAKDRNICVVPAVELSTPQGHLLCYFRSVEALRRFYGRLEISEDHKQCHTAMLQCLELAKQQEGFCILAHIELDTGFEGMNTRQDPFKLKLLESPVVLAMEISTKAAIDWYTDADTNASRKGMLSAIRAARRLGENFTFPKTMSSDAHSILQFGRNAEGNKKLTRIKMSNPSFEALRIALLDGSARIKLEDFIPESIPHFVGLRFGGGLLDGQAVHLNRNLNCIIGGRGSGKSTLLESLRAASGNEARRDLVDSEVGSDELILMYRDQTGRDWGFRRCKGRCAENLRDGDDGLAIVPIDCFGQGETADTIQHCGKEPIVLLQFFDKLIPTLPPLLAEDEQIRDALLENQTAIESLNLTLSQKKAVEQARYTVVQQIQTLKEKDAERIVSLEQKLARGVALRGKLKSGFEALSERQTGGYTFTDLDAFLSSEESEVAVGKHAFENCKEVVRDIKAKLNSFVKQEGEEISSARSKLNLHYKEWLKEEAKVKGEIEELRKELAAKNIKLDINFIRKLTADKESYDQRLATMRIQEEERKGLFKKRRLLLKQRRELRSRIFTIRSSMAMWLQNQLREVFDDYSVAIRFSEGTLSSDLERLIKEAMGWRTSAVPKAKCIVEFFGWAKLLDILDKGDTATLLTCLSDVKETFLQVREANEIIQTLSKDQFRFQLERIAFEDTPNIMVSRTYRNQTKAAPRVRTRPFHQLSLGQQQAILLSILLFAHNNTPLVIDQPEDNLDSEFVYKTFVKTLRTIKERRQVIIVTHNANIAVLGDAELIIPLRATIDRSMVMSRGSIDNEETKQLACTILEGSKEAFLRRKEMYGILQD